jgi:hypothetical protein
MCRPFNFNNNTFRRLQSSLRIDALLAFAFFFRLFVSYGQETGKKKASSMSWLSSANLVPRRGLEPPHLAALVPETSASTNFATWAIRCNRSSEDRHYRELFQ